MHGGHSLPYDCGMTTDDLLAYYDGQTGVALALGIKQPSVARWGKFPPLLRQLQAEALTHGELTAEPECDRYRVGFGIIGAAKTARRKRAA